MSRVSLYASRKLWRQSLRVKGFRRGLATFQPGNNNILKHKKL